MNNLIAAFVWASLVMFVTFSVGCEQKAKEEKNVKKEASQDYPVEGEVIAVGEDRKAITIDHKEIPNLMKAMNMEFRVEDSSLLEGIHAGDKVQGRLKVEGGEYTIIDLSER